MKTPPPWLAELHRQWQAARGRRADGAVMAFARDWEKLLDTTGLRTADDRMAAGREAADLEKDGRLVLVRQRYRTAIERVRLPLEQEGWLRALFGSECPAELRARSMAVVEAAAQKRHPLFPEAWTAWCGKVLTDFPAGKSRRPLVWNKPEVVREVMARLFLLTSREWPPGTLVRDASVALGWDSKALERHRAALEAALGGLFQLPGRLGMESLNLMMTNSVLVFHGPLELHVPGGTAEPSRWLDHASSVTAADLERAERITTTARALLTVENAKSPFRHAVAANHGAEYLIVATSFPTRAVRLLLEKLPAVLPHYHFGDTDAAGYLILQKLREALPSRPVRPLLMDWRDNAGSPPLTDYDRRTIRRLLDSSLMEDLHKELRKMLDSGRKGDFEQENRLAELPQMIPSKTVPQTRGW